ncbi:FAD-dependent oxidoreductase [Propylenella binzhouense]|uniref:FAD-dependent oxidoreductase n=1 Tax=Propylenella binzhouense TaxID=2555902 RepID=A0A964T1C5_9HYPH|nr:FAD-dependent oxidoreductase [Propylenella binzhouense]MYZ46561.1 FAD-dependent oxidoreductase [Propylenella binzhouense]
MNRVSFDVVVAGCGVAGLSAAVAAAEKGARVAIIERTTREERGGQSRYTEAYLRMKSESEVSDDFESHIAENCSGYLDPELLTETVRPTEERSAAARALSLSDPDFIQTFAEQSGPTIAWLKQFGVKFDFLPTQFLTKSQPRLLPVGGGEALVEALAEQAERRGVTFYYETTAQSLELDEDGQVVGLVTRGSDGRRLVLNGKVVLASGGFEGNAEMLAHYLGPRSINLRPVSRGGYLNRGEGIRMALHIGAAAAGDFASYHAEPIDPRAAGSEPSVFIFPYGILVNSEGRRFTDEAPGTVDAYYERVTRRIYEQTNGLAYVVLDAKHMDVPNYKLAIRTDQPPIVGNAIGELAEKIGVPADVLESTVKAYNDACQPGTYKPLELDGLATRGLNPPKSNWALPIDKGPYHAYPIISSNVFTFGGLKVDVNARVLDSDGRPIGGLYAAGETIGVYYRNYTGATSVLKGLVFGRLAGIDAATRR